MFADLVLYNGHVYTLDPKRPQASAVAVARERILAVGDDAEMRSLLKSKGEAVDLRGCTVVPGFTDGHVHFMEYALGLSKVDMADVPSLEECLHRVAARAAVTPPGEWLQGGRWNRNLWPGGRFPTKDDLDQVAPEHPAAFRSKDGHVLWVNSLALRRAGITAETPDPPGGEIERDARGQPTGILKEKAIELVEGVIPPPSPAAVMAALREGFRRAWQVGLTGIHDCEGAEALTAFQRLRASGELGLRVLMHIPVDNLEAAIQVGLRSGFGDEWLRIGGVKIFADGALGSRTAAMLEPYEGEPDNRGIIVTPPKELAELVRRANEAGLSVAIHAIGDQANRYTLDALAATQPLTLSETSPSLPNRIEHVQLLHPADLPRLARLRVIASMQPIHCTSDMEMAERYWGTRARWSYAWRSLLEAGTTLCFGSDCPVEPLAPLRGIHAAVTRRRPDGSPGPEGWYPQERLTVSQAVYAYTLGCAIASGEAHLKGSITPGKLADLVILSQDIFQIEPMGILETEVVGTIIGGRMVYRQF